MPQSSPSRVGRPLLDRGRLETAQAVDFTPELAAAALSQRVSGQLLATSQARLVRCSCVFPAANLSHDLGLAPAVVGAVAANLPAALFAYSSTVAHVSELGAVMVSGPSQWAVVRQVAGLLIRPHMAHRQERRGRLPLVVPGSNGAGVPAVMSGLSLLGRKIAGTSGVFSAAA